MDVVVHSASEQPVHPHNTIAIEGAGGKLLTAFVQKLAEARDRFGRARVEAFFKNILPHRRRHIHPVVSSRETRADFRG